MVDDKLGVPVASELNFLVYMKAGGPLAFAATRMEIQEKGELAGTLTFYNKGGDRVAMVDAGTWVSVKRSDA